MWPSVAWLVGGRRTTGGRLRDERGSATPARRGRSRREESSAFLVEGARYRLGRQRRRIPRNAEHREALARTFAARSKASARQVGKHAAEARASRSGEATCRLQDVGIDVDGGAHAPRVAADHHDVKMS